MHTQDDNLIPVVKKAIACCLVLIIFELCCSAQIEFNEEEKLWLNEHKAIRYAPDPNFPPFEYVDKNGRVLGITPDILKAISQRVNIQFTNVVYSSWSDVLNGIKQGEVDLLGTITRTPERESFLEFTSPYLNVPVVVFVHKNNPEFTSVKNLKGRRVGVVKNYGAESWLKINHPEFNIVPVSSPREGMIMLAFKKIDAFVEVLPVGLYVISENSLTSVAHSKETLYMTPQHFAVSKTNRILLGIMEKAIQQLPETDRMAIFNEWTRQIPAEPGVVSKNLITILFILIGVVIGAFLIIVSMQKIIHRRTAELKRSEELFKGIFQNNPLVAGITTLKEGRIIEVNKKFEELSGYSRNELLGRTTLEFGFWVDVNQRNILIEKVKKEGIVKNYEAKIRVRDGRILTMLFNVQLFREDDEEFMLFLINDITEYLKTQELQRRLAEIVEATNAIVVTSDANFNLFYINDAGIKILGLKNSDGISVKKLTDLFPADQQKYITSVAIPSAIKDGIWEWESQIKIADGKIIPTVNILIAHKKPDGSVDYLSLIARDISNLKSAYEMVRRSEERLRQIIEHSNQLFYIQDNENRIVFVSPQVKEFFDAEPDECIDKCWIDFLSDNPVNQIGIELTELAIRTGERQKPYELEFVGKKGRRVWAQVNESPIVVNGKTVAIVGSLTDITERKKIEEKLRERENFIEMVAKNSPDLIVVFDIQTKKRVYANKNRALILGYERAEDFDFTEFLTYVHPDDVKKINEHFEELKKAPDGAVLTVEYRLKNKSGEYLTFLARDTVFQRDSTGNVTLILSIHQDITEVKRFEAETHRLEAQLRQSQKMEAIGRLAGGVAHDFNNVLTVINGCTEMLLLNEKVEDQVKDCAIEIRKAAKRAQDLTKQLLMFSRKQVMEPLPLEVNQIIRDLTKMLKRLIGEDIKVVLNLQEGLPLINGDRSMIETALTNLAVNARDAMPKGGTLTITTETKKVETELVSKNPEAYKGKFIAITVSDTGIGIDEKTLSRIFEPFFTTKETGKGVGLGLSVVYGVVKQHGGWVDVESEIGKGTKFTMYFPVLEKAVETVVKKEEKAAENLYGSETILVVEDDEQVRKIAVMALRNFGYNVIEARNGAEALKLWEEFWNIIDLVFTDVIMPGGISGIELAEKLRHTQPELKIIFTSGYTAEFLQVQADLSSMGVFIKKPFDTVSLLRIIRRCLDTGGW